MFTPRLVVIAHPRLLETPIVSTSDCLRYPLLQDRERSDWLLWLGLDEADAPRAATKGSGYANDALLIEAAASGQGLAVVRDVYAHDAIASGRVVLASPRKIATEARYFVVTKPTRLAAAKTKTFRRWLQDACAASACPSPALTTE